MAYEDKPGTGSSYDQSLLASAPEATRAEKQEGYNVDLLADGRRPRGAASPAINQTIDIETGPLRYDDSGPPHHDTRGGYTRAPNDSDPSYPVNGTSLISSPKRHWYRTRNGIIAIIIITLIIIGAVVGGAVGGTQHHRNNKDSSGSGSSLTASPSNGQVSQSSDSAGGGGGSESTTVSQGGLATPTGHGSSSATASLTSAGSGQGQGEGETATSSPTGLAQGAP